MSTDESQEQDGSTTSSTALTGSGYGSGLTGSGCGSGYGSGLTGSGYGCGIANTDELGLPDVPPNSVEPVIKSIPYEYKNAIKLE